MTDASQLKILKQGVAAWNQWRRRVIVPINLRMVNLRGADLHGVDLSEADLNEANLSIADLREADLRMANLHRAKLHEADLRECHCGSAIFVDTALLDVNLSHCKGLESIIH